MDENGKEKGPNRIGLWKVLVGAMIHFLPVWMACAVIYKVMEDGGLLLTPAAIRSDIGVGEIALASWALTTLALGVAAAVGSTVAKTCAAMRDARSPAAAARLAASDLAFSLLGLHAMAARIGDDRMAADLESIREVAQTGWDHKDPRFQKVARDIADARRILPDAVGDGSDRTARQDAEMAIATLAAATREVRDGRMRDGAQDARSFSNYLNASYGPPPGDPLRIP